MKTTTVFTALALCTPALMAGEVEYTQPTMQTNYAPAGHVGWFLGGGADYLLDSEEPFYNAHLGYDFGGGHSLFLESGWVGEEDDLFFPFPASVDIDIVPITLNYKYEWLITDRFGFYAGVGAGGANVDIAGPLGGDDSWTFTAQALAGVVYEVSPSFELYAGARYAWLDDVSVRGATYDDLDDIGIGAGLRFNF